MKYSFKLVRPIEDTTTQWSQLSNIHNAIFLAGPCPRKNYDTDWRFDAYKILNDMGFTGTVITPTNHNYNKMVSSFNISKTDALKAQTTWERVAMHLASAIVFWIPRSEEFPARTTNIEFGEWYKKQGIFIGWPDGAIHNEYIELKMAEQNKKRHTTLEAVLKSAVQHISKPKTEYFTADTHFNQKRTLDLSRRPFNDVNEMDLTLMSNWNKSVGMNDIVYHGGDFIDPERIDDLSSFLNNLNFAELHWTLGNYDRKVVAQIKEQCAKLDRKVYIYGDDNVTDNLCRLTSDGTKFVIVHEPADFTYDIKKDEVVLYGHIHGRSFAKLNGFDLATDYHRYTPISMEQVKWFVNAMKYWDKNVFADKVATINS